MSIETMTKISTVTVGAGGSASISFSNIPQDYTDLVLKLSTRTTASGWTTTGLVLTFNGSSASVYSRISMYNTAAGSAGSDSTSSTTSFTGGIVSCGASATGSVFGIANVYISNYSGNTFKTITTDSVSENNGTDTAQTLTTGLFANSSPITSLTLTDSNSGSFVQHSTATLYGVKNAAKTAGNSIKATGGNVVFDGTYVYHVFNTTSAFTPTQSLTADVLVVAGGGGAGYFYGGGGGGGGVRQLSSQTLAVGSSYTATIGSGGAGSGSSSSKGSSGSNSSFLTVSTTGGGGGGSNSSSSGLSGGSGGGASNTGTAGSGNAGGYSPVEGYDGYSFNSSNKSGGGGGAGGAATDRSGANGTSAYSAWGVATGAGERVSGLYWFAGGGAGYDSANGGNGGGGGSPKGYFNSPANTGGGGGSDSGNGGSGIVIVRYKG